MPYHSMHAQCGPKRLVLTRYPYSIISGAELIHKRARPLTSTLRVYGKAGNGSGMETGNGKWKWKLETEI